MRKGAGCDVKPRVYGPTPLVRKNLIKMMLIDAIGWGAALLAEPQDPAGRAPAGPGVDRIGECRQARCGREGNPSISLYNHWTFHLNSNHYRECYDTLTIRYLEVTTMRQKKELPSRSECGLRNSYNIMERRDLYCRGRLSPQCKSRRRSLRLVCRRAVDFADPWTLTKIVRPEFASAGNRPKATQ